MIPKPNGELLPRDGSYLLEENMTVDTGEFGRGCLAAFEQRLEICCRETREAPQLTLCQNGGLPREGYEITVDTGGIRVEASEEAGVIWALTTLFHQTRGRTVPYFSLRDAPRYRYRAQSLDCCRHFFDIGEVCRILEQMSLVKMNALHWHLTDDQGWRIEIRAFPQLAETSGQYYTQDQIREVVRFAAERGIAVIPEIDLPGHTRAALCAIPRLGCFGEKLTLAQQGGVFTDILCAGKETTYDFVSKVMNEIAELFPSPVIHIGGDEVPKKRWKQCPDCTKKMTDNGLPDYEALQGYFMNRVADSLKSKQKSVRCWDDVLNAGNYGGEEIQFWLAGKGPKGVRQFSARGGIVYSEMFHLYLDYPCSMIPLKRVYRYTPKIGAAVMADHASTLGIESCMWAERVETPEQLERRLFPRLFAVAEAAWTRRRNYRDFIARLTPVLTALDAQGIAYLPLAACDPKGIERKRETLGYFRTLQETTALSREETDSALTPGMVRRFLRNFLRLGDLPDIIRLMKAARTAEK